MPKTNHTTIKSITEYKSANDLAARNRELLTSRLTALYEDGRRVDDEKRRIVEETTLIETALAVEQPSPRPEVGKRTKAPKVAKTPKTLTQKARKAKKGAKGAAKKGPSGEISPAIFAFVLKHPGAKSAEIRDGVRIGGKNMVKYAGGMPKAKMTIGTALNAMKKHGYLRVEGTRSNYGYHAVN